jgi:hypothetical protein
MNCRRRLRKENTQKNNAKIDRGARRAYFFLRGEKIERDSPFIENTASSDFYGGAAYKTLLSP